MRSFPIILMVGLHYDSSDIGKTSHEAPMSGCFTPHKVEKNFRQGVLFYARSSFNTISKVETRT